MMHTKVVLTVFMCFYVGFISAESNQTPPPSNKLIVIDDPVLHLVDGTPAIAVNNIRYFVARCRELQSGKKTDQGSEGLLEFNGKKVSIKDMVKVEEEINNDKAHPSYNACNTAFDDAADYFAEISLPYLEEISYTKGYLIKLIDRWSKQRCKPHTILLDWANIDGTEVDSIRKSITNFKKMDSLINDLTMFLADLLISCPRSFIAAFKDPEEGRAILNKIRAQNGCSERA